MSVSTSSVPNRVTLAKMSGTRMMSSTSIPGGWYGGDWNYAEMCASVLDAYEMREMSGSYPSVSFYTYLGMLSDLVTPGSLDGSSALLRSHCTAMRVMLADMMSRIDRECAELSALLDSCIWDATN